MSADNTIVVLGTKCHWIKTGSVWVKSDPYTIYRVAHVQAWDNYDWYKVNQPYNLGAYLAATFSRSHLLMTLDEAMKVARELEKHIGFVEYGIQVIETDYILYGD